VAKATANYEQLKSKQPKSTMMVLISTSGVAEALRERFNEDNICVMLPSGSASALYPAGNTFCIVISHPDGFGFFIDWLAETQQKPIKLGLLNWDSTFGRSIMTDECANYAKSQGVEIVATELFGLRELDVTTQLTKIQNAGATWVYTNTLGFGTVSVMKSVDAMGLRDKMNFAGGHFAMDYDILRVAEEATEGFVGPHSVVTWDEVDNPYVAERRQAFDAAGRPDSYRAQPFLVFRGWFTWAADVQEAAIKEVGWEKLNDEALKAEIVKTKDLKLPWTTLNFSADKPETNWARMVQFKGGKVLPISDWRKAPDLRPAQYK
jgi:ABC-type branched-subunit amino acid transport system substrate-binding protein